jgi:hypothetical protein
LTDICFLAPATSKHCDRGRHRKGLTAIDIPKLLPRTSYEQTLRRHRTALTACLSQNCLHRTSHACEFDTFTTAGLRPPLLFARCVRSQLKKDDICDAQTHVYKSGGREPAVGIANAGAVALVCHGRLTPTALVLRCERLSAKNNFCDEQTHVYRSGGRQPAVASVTQLRQRLLTDDWLLAPMRQS